MIKYTTGNIFDSNADILVNPVNTRGVCGKGLALEFKKRFPENYKSYRDCCKNYYKYGGDIIWYLINQPPQKWICNFCTKEDWKNPSKIEWIQKGLSSLKKDLQWSCDNSRIIAIPKLGCGNGGLDWNEVKQLIEDILGNLENEVYVYE